MNAMRPVDILYVGPASGTCLTRLEALRRLGHRPMLLDPSRALPAGFIADTWTFKTGAFALGGLVEAYIAGEVAGKSFDLVYVDGGELISPRGVRLLRRAGGRVVNYNPDNPYVTRDGLKWRLFLRAIPEYDLMVVPREESVGDARARGAREVMRVWQAADDPLRDDARLPSAEAKAPYRSAVSFVGTWMPERGTLLAGLLERGVPLRIFGPRWNRAPEFPRLAPHTTVSHLATDAYDAAVAAADVSIALLSKGNRDLHTTRSLQIPALGSLLCGERTVEHEMLYRDGEEALLWSSVEDCAELCLDVLADRDRLARLTAAGRRRALANNHFNEPFMDAIVRRALAAEALAS
jgi:spore maturation protein CgeB